MKYEDEQIANLILSLKKLKGVGNKTIQKVLKGNKKELESTSNYTVDFLINLKNNTILKGLNNIGIDWNTIQKNVASSLELAYEQNISVLHPYMPEYPQRLLVNENFPPILFCKGDITILNSPKIVAVIGTREPTEFGEKMGLRLSSLLSEDNYVIVSGLALGCDTVGHLGALEASGKTIAVLPTPIDQSVYPKENQKLADDIVAAGGLLISEYEPGSQLRGKELVANLVARDEWQSGLSDGVIVMETSLKGGSNHAIKHAIKTKTPLALFDYSLRLGDMFFKDERYSGNVKYIRENEAKPLYLSETVDSFKEDMKEYYSKLIFKDWTFKKREISKETTQIKLF